MFVSTVEIPCGVLGTLLISQQHSKGPGLLNIWVSACVCCTQAHPSTAGISAWKKQMKYLEIQAAHAGNPRLGKLFELQVGILADHSPIYKAFIQGTAAAAAQCVWHYRCPPGLADHNAMIKASRKTSMSYAYCLRMLSGGTVKIRNMFFWC